MSTQDNNEFKKMDDQEYEIDTLTNQRLIKDHSYDGIQELDNDLPPWWKWLFYISVVFGIVYLVRLWVFEADDLIQVKEYEKEMARAVANAPQQAAEFKLEVLTDAASLAAGKETYNKICAVCHLADGGGQVGPNFTDDYWIHSNSLDDMFDIVEKGVPGTSMLAYESQMSKKARLKVISYIITLHGTTPANPKAAEGDLLDWPY